MDMYEEANQEQYIPEEPTLEVNDTVRDHLANAAKWGRFLSIVGFVGIGLTVVLGLFFGAFINMMTSGLYNEDMFGYEEGFLAYGIFSPWFYTMIYFIFAVIYFFPVLYLYRFSSKMLKALPGQNQEQMESSLSNLKSLFSYMGILTIVLLGLYGLIVVLIAWGGIGAMMM